MMSPELAAELSMMSPELGIARNCARNCGIAAWNWGTGKTQTLAMRIKYLTEELKIPPGQVTVITFTAPAASNKTTERFWDFE